MDLNKYINEYSHVTEKKFPHGKELNAMQMELLHAAMGVSTEAGELLDAMKKHLVYGKELDMANINEELGDLYWYLAIIHRYLQDKGVTPENTLSTNIRKLAKRYPDGFTSKDALERDLGEERQILEDGINLDSEEHS